MLITLSYKVQAKHYLLSVLVIRLGQAGGYDLHHDVPVEATLQLEDHLLSVVLAVTYCVSILGIPSNQIWMQ